MDTLYSFILTHIIYLTAFLPLLVYLLSLYYLSVTYSQASYVKPQLLDKIDIEFISACTTAYNEILNI